MVWLIQWNTVHLWKYSEEQLYKQVEWFPVSTFKWGKNVQETICGMQLFMEERMRNEEIYRHVIICGKEILAV